MIEEFRSSLDFGSGLATPTSVGRTSHQDTTVELSPQAIGLGAKGKRSPAKAKPASPSRATQRLSVYVRKRPLGAEEIHTRFFDVVTVIDDETVTVHEPKTKFDLSRTLDNHAFLFDGVFDESASSEDVYNVSESYWLSCCA